MMIKVDPTGTHQGLKNITNEFLEADQVKSLFILSCDANNFTPDTIDPLLKEIPIPLFGGIFPQIIHEKEKMDKGTIVVGINSAMDTHIIPGLSDKDMDYEAMIDKEVPEIGTIQTIFVFVDGLAQRIGSFISSLYNIFGAELNYVGGGAGSLSMKQKPCLFTNDGLIKDSAVLAILNLKSGVGVSHGYSSVGGPFKATETEQNSVKSLDWRPALEVYKEFIQAHSRKVLNEETFFEIAPTYPFGITKMGTERVVRDPVMMGENQSIICVGEVPQGSFLDIMEGDESSLIAAAGKALALSKEAFQRQKEKTLTIFMDCISRVLFLKTRFAEELKSVYEDGQPLVGACTIGEIAAGSGGYLEFHNKTAVVATMEAK
ncbi:MAG: FIST N-terminal domain-containing protein [Candidatus Aminicenantes bacterium]|jgi:hypothetical protein